MVLLEMLCFIKIFFSPFLTLVIICLSTIVSSFYALCVGGEDISHAFLFAFFLFTFCSYVWFFFFIALFSFEGERERNPWSWMMGGGEDLRGDEGGETTIKIYSMKNKL